MDDHYGYDIHEDMLYVGDSTYAAAEMPRGTWDRIAELVATQADVEDYLRGLIAQSREAALQGVIGHCKDLSSDDQLKGHCTLGL